MIWLQTIWCWRAQYWQHCNKIWWGIVSWSIPELSPTNGLCHVLPGLLQYFLLGLHRLSISPDHSWPCPCPPLIHPGHGQNLFGRIPTAQGIWCHTQSCGHHMTIVQPCAQQATSSERPPHWQNWDLGFQPLFSFYLCPYQANTSLISPQLCTCTCYPPDQRLTVMPPMSCYSPISFSPHRQPP